MAASWPRLYLLIAIPLALFLAVALPLGEAPDEEAHVARAASVLRGQLVGHRAVAPHPVDGSPIAVAGVDIDPAFVAPMLRLPVVADAPRKPVPAEAVARADAVAWSGGVQFVGASNTAGYMPLPYVPAAIGMGLARLLGGMPADAVMAGRLANAAASIGIAYLAIRLAGHLAPALFALLTLPMTVHLAASVNQDGPLIALSALAAALLSRGGRRPYWLGVAALACVVAGKPAYLPLAVAALVPLDGAGWRAGRHGAGCLAVVSAGLAWAAVAASMAVVPYWRAPYAPGPLWPGDPAALFNATDPAAQLRVLLGHASLIVTLPAETVAASWNDLLDSAIGVLGPLDLRLPDIYYDQCYAALAAALACICIAGPARRSPLRGLAVLASVLACAGGIFILQYLTWSRVGDTVIEGVQGRYLLPLTCIALTAPPLLRRTDRSPGALDRILYGLILATGALGMVVVPISVIARYR